MCVCVHVLGTYTIHICNAIEPQLERTHALHTHFTLINSKLSVLKYYLTFSQWWYLISLDFLEEFIEGESEWVSKKEFVRICSSPYACPRFSFDSIQLVYSAEVCTQKRTVTKKEYHFICCIVQVFISKNVPVVFTRSIASNSQDTFLGKMLSSMVLFFLFCSIQCIAAFVHKQ